MIRVCLIDDHALVRRGLKRILADAGIDVVAEADTVAEGTQLALTTECDVLLLDLTLPDGDGFEVLARVVRDRPALPVLVSSVHPEGVYAPRALRAGASGYLDKTLPPGELIAAIRALAAGKRHFPKDLNV